MPEFVLDSYLKSNFVSVDSYLKFQGKIHGQNKTKFSCVILL